MSFDASVAHRAAVDPSSPVAASIRKAPRRGVVVALLAALLAVGTLAAAPAPASAAGIRVAVIVGPAGSLTSTYIKHARAYASLARSYGASVAEVYTPNATWSRVRTAAQGVNLLVYLGHGNGFPNPYNAVMDPLKVNGLGLNPTTDSGNTKTKYFGEYYVRKNITLAPNAVVLLNHLCYSAGSSEPGRANPSLKVAKQRADNYGGGFIRAGAKAVFAETLGNAAYVIRGLFASNKTMSQIFWSAPNRTGTYRITFDSVRTPGMRVIMDPRKPGQYYRAVTGNLSMTAGAWRP